MLVHFHLNSKQNFMRGPFTFLKYNYDVWVSSPMRFVAGTYLEDLKARSY